MLYGARYTVGLALAATVLASVHRHVLRRCSPPVSGRWVDEVLSRLLDTLISIPSKMFALVVVAAFGSSVPMLIVGRRAHLHARRLPHLALARGQHNDARLRAGRARARRRHCSTSRASRSCPT